MMELVNAVYVIMGAGITLGLTYGRIDKKISVVSTKVEMIFEMLKDHLQEKH